MWRVSARRREVTELFKALCDTSANRELAYALALLYSLIVGAAIYSDMQDMLAARAARTRRKS